MDYKYQRILWDIEKLLEQMRGNLGSQCKETDTHEYMRDTQRNGFYINQNQGNNTFDYRKGKKIWVPPLIYGDIKNILPGEKIVFQDEGQKSTGLMYYVCGKTHTNKTPIFLCDNHNAVLEIWKPFYEKNKTKAILIHIDQHKDDAIFHDSYNDDFRKTTKICDYIDYAISKKWISQNVYSFTESMDLQKIKHLHFADTSQYIINIDLDFFALELSSISLLEKMQLITQCIKKADVITLATSPLFIHQEFAREIAKLFWKYF